MTTKPTTPDRYERLLAFASMLLLLAVLTALARGYPTWGQVCLLYTSPSPRD